MSDRKYIHNHLKTRIGSIYSDNVEELMQEHGQFAFVVDKNDYVIAIKNKTTGVIEYRYTNELPIIKKILDDIQELRLEHSEEISSQLKNLVRSGIDSIIEEVLGELVVQADWNSTDAESRAYIKNKPTLLSDFINDLVYDSRDVVYDNIVSGLLANNLQDAVDEIVNILATNILTLEDIEEENLTPKLITGDVLSKIRVDGGIF